jgi:hypothetical protein
MMACAYVDPIEVLRDAEHERVKKLIEDIEAAGVTLYKIALLLHRPFNTVKYWKKTGRVESYECRRLEEIHREYCNFSHITTTRN